MKKIVNGLLQLSTGLILVAFSLSASAVDSVSFEAGGGTEVKMARVGMQWNWNKKWFQSNGTHIGGYWDLTLGQWHATKYKDNPDRSQDITVIGFTPTFRFQRDSMTGFYLEGGIGTNLLSELYNNNDDRLSTAFQFGDHIGVGYVFSNKLDIGLKYQHYSNGGIKNPNSGVDFVVLKASYPF